MFDFDLDTLGLASVCRYGFEAQLAGAKGPWVRVNVSSATKDTVSITLPSDATATALRYAFDDVLSIFTTPPTGIVRPSRHPPQV